MGKSVQMGLWVGRHQRTHRSLSLSHLSLLQTGFTGIQVQAKVLQKTPFFLDYTQWHNQGAAEHPFLLNPLWIMVLNCQVTVCFALSELFNFTAVQSQCFLAWNLGVILDVQLYLCCQHCCNNPLLHINSPQHQEVAQVLLQAFVISHLEFLWSWFHNKLLIDIRHRLETRGRPTVDF